MARKKNKPIPIRKKVKFLVECEPKDGSGIVYKEGAVETLSATSANHWVRRGKAIEFTGKEKVEAKKADKPSAELKTLEIKPEEKKSAGSDYKPTPPITATDLKPEIEKAE